MKRLLLILLVLTLFGCSNKNTYSQAPACEPKLLDKETKEEECVTRTVGLDNNCDGILQEFEVNRTVTVCEKEVMPEIEYIQFCKENKNVYLIKFDNLYMLVYNKKHNILIRGYKYRVPHTNCEIEL